MHDAYADWREETAHVRATYAQWSDATAADQAWASTAYVAALDREEAAADRYARLAARVSRRRKTADSPSASPARTARPESAMWRSACVGGWVASWAPRWPSAMSRMSSARQRRSFSLTCDTGR